MVSEAKDTNAQDWFFNRYPLPSQTPAEWQGMGKHLFKQMQLLSQVLEEGHLMMLNASAKDGMTSLEYQFRGEAPRTLKSKHGLGFLYNAVIAEILSRAQL
jgi:hypothetical protein